MFSKNSLLNNRTQYVLLHDFYLYEDSVMFDVPQGSVLGPIFLVSLLMTFHYMWTIYFSIVTCWQMTQDCKTSGNDILQISSNTQNSLDQVSNWCDINYMVINPIKITFSTIATRQNHQLSSLPLDLVLRWAKIDQVEGVF